MSVRNLLRLRAAALPLLGLLALVPAVHAQQAPLQERMSYAEFKKVGLDKLSPAQLKELNHWLAEHGCSGASMSSATAATPMARQVHKGKIVSRLVGDFHGWDSGTVFTLKNGQRWQVTGDSQLTIRTIHQPQVTVSKGFFGTWLLSVKGVDEIVHVVPAK